MPTPPEASAIPGVTPALFAVLPRKSKHVNNLLLSELTAPGVRSNEQFVIKVATVLEMWIFNHFMTQDPRLRPAMLKYGESLGKRQKAPPRAATR